MYQAFGPHGPVSSRQPPRTRTTKTSAWTGPSVPHGRGATNVTSGSGFWTRPRQYFLARRFHVVVFKGMLLNDQDELALGSAHHDTARTVDDQHSAARLFAHGFSPASLRQGHPDPAVHGAIGPTWSNPRPGERSGGWSVV